MPPRRKAIPTIDNSKELEMEGNNVDLVKKFGILFLFRRYGEVSSISGVPQLQRSQEILRSIMWAIIILGAACVLLYQIQLAVVKFLKYDVSTSVKRNVSNALEFPAITICNQNPVDYKKILSINKDIFAKLKSWESNAPQNNPMNTTITASATSSTTSKGNQQNQMPNINGFGGRTADETYQRQLELQAMMATLNYQQKVQAGMSLDDMLISCFFNNYLCNTSDFYQFYNFQYGNCFTYNLLSNKSILQTLEIGPQYGLKMILFINSSAYIPITLNSGIRLLVHHPTEYPFPEDVGIGAVPGKLNSVGLQLTVATISYPPYNSCQNLTTTQAMELSAYVGQLPNVSYTKEGCMKTCTQKYILMYCQCYHPFYPYNSSMLAYRNISSVDLRMCDINYQTTDAICCANTKIAIMNGTFDCKNCSLACKKNSYSITVSNCNWPSTIAQQSIINQLSGLPAMAYLQQSVNSDNIISTQIMQLEIYFESMTYLDITEQPAYEFVSLISDFGGLMGLWLGLSVAACFEIFELLFDTIVTLVKMMVIRYRDGKKKNKTVLSSKLAWEKF